MLSGHDNSCTPQPAHQASRSPAGSGTRSVSRLALALALSLLVACGSPGTPGPGPAPDPDPEPDPEPVHEARVEYEVATATGMLVLPPGSTLDFADLVVSTLAGSTAVSASGNYSVDAPVTDGLQMHIFRSTSTGNPVLIGFGSAGGGESVVSAESTALALLLLHPYASLLPPQKSPEFLSAGQSAASFPQLTAALEQAYAADAETALELDDNPGLYQLVMEVVEEAVAGLASPPAAAALAGAAELPTIEDAAGAFIDFLNPHYVHYAAGIEALEAVGVSSVQDAVLLAARTRTADEWDWAWPPATPGATPARTTHPLGDGYFRIDLQSFDPALLGSWSSLPAAAAGDPLALATLHNTAATLRLLFRQVMQHEPVPVIDERAHADYPEELILTGPINSNLLAGFANRDADALTAAFVGMMAANAGAIASWLWAPGEEDAAAYVSMAARLLHNMVRAAQAYDYGDDRFFPAAALYGAPPTSYFVTQEAGVIVSFDQNAAPVAGFTVSPPAGTVGTVFAFDAAPTTDDIAPDQLRFRWDFDGDGTWDTDWTADRTATHTYAQDGAYTVRLEARDSIGLLSVAARTVNVGGGAGTASHILLLRDHYPWTRDGEEPNNSTVVVIESLGFVEGKGPMTYEVVPSSEFATVSLTPGDDLVIVSNDQKHDFYLAYARNQVRFNNFVWQGGSIFWGAADLGWNQGSILMAGVELPGRVVQMHQYDRHNYVVDPDLPLTAGLPMEMEHNLASHERFSDLVGGTTVYLVDSFGQPTLIEFNLGRGWVIMPGQPLEHQYRYPFGEHDLESLLARIISYFTGVERGAEPVQVRPLATGVAPASGMP